MNKIYELKRDIMAECVDADERSLCESQKLNCGTQLIMIRGAHTWGKIKGLKYSTVQVGSKYFNIPTPVLTGSLLLVS